MMGLYRRQYGVELANLLQVFFVFNFFWEQNFLQTADLYGLAEQ